MQISFQQRINLALPPWFGDDHPVLDAVTYTLAAGSTTTDEQIAALAPLLRINTTSGEFLDMVALDFYGVALTRNSGETDAEFRARIKDSLLVARATRDAFIANVLKATGILPTVIEPRQPKDTGVLGNVALNIPPTLFYNSPFDDCYTNLNMPWQWAVKMEVPQGIGLARLRQIINENMPAGTVTWLHTL